MQRAGGLCEQRGKDGAPDARQRREDRPVALLTWLPRGGVFVGGELVDQSRERAVRVARLPVEQAHSLGEEPDMGAGGADDAGGDRDGIGAQSGEDRVGLEATASDFSWGGHSHTLESNVPDRWEGP